VTGLVRAGIIVPGRARFSHRHFFVTEPKLRLVFDGRRLNARCPEPPSFEMSRHHQYSALAARYRFAAKFDLKDFFFNVRLAAHLRPLFGFRCSAGDFCWARTPFGWNWSPYFADCIASDLVRHLRSLGFEVIHYCDDFTVFADSQEDCDRALQAAIKFCESVGLRVKHSKTVLPCTSLPIVGVQYDLMAKTSAMPAAYWAPLRWALNRWGRSGSARRVDVAAFVGSLVFCNNAFPGSLSLLNGLFAALAGWQDIPWGSRVSVAGLLPSASAVLSLFESFPACALQEGRGETAVVVHHDATPTQVAVCWLDRVEARQIPERHIFEAEAEGFELALQLTAEAPHRLFVSDNRALHLALRKGRSSNAYANRLVFAVLQHRLRGQVLRFQWVPSAENRADAASRMDLREHVH
jgi:hypothetical protein